jgi:hypothetical protein
MPALARAYDPEMRLALLAVLFLTAPAQADSVAYTCRAAANVTLVEKHGACTGFATTDAKGREVQRVTGLPMISGSVHATADGTTAVVVHGYPLQAKAFDDVPAVLVFRGGKELARYSMKELIERMDLVSHSVSHVSWILEQPPLVLAKSLVLTTSSLKTHTLDLATGKKTTDDAALWKTCDAIVYIAQTTKHADPSVAVIPEPWVAKGPLVSKRPLTVKLATGVRASSGSTLCLRSEAQRWSATSNIAVMYNLLPR